MRVHTSDFFVFSSNLIFNSKMSYTVNYVEKSWKSYNFILNVLFFVFYWTLLQKKINASFHIQIIFYFNLDFVCLGCYVRRRMQWVIFNPFLSLLPILWACLPANLDTCVCVYTHYVLFNIQNLSLATELELLKEKIAKMEET